MPFKLMIFIEGQKSAQTGPSSRSVKLPRNQRIAEMGIVFERKFVSFFQRVILVLSLILSSISARAADAPCDDPCGKPTAWNDFNVFTLKASLPNAKGYASWQGKWDKESSDISIAAENSNGSITKSGKILMISGRVLAVQGQVADSGYEMDALDAPVLQLQLVLRLLGAALPDGTNGIKGSRQIDYSQQKTGIQFATQSAEGFIAPPWRVKGRVTLLAPDDVRYDLALTSGLNGKPMQKGGPYAQNFVGRLSKTSGAKLDDSMSLNGWTLFGVGVQKKQTSKGTTFDYNAAPSEVTYKTIADVRKHLAAENDPGKPDATKDFTGFWKTKCENAFGLQIKHIGDEGMYSIVFCGPGGCGDPDQGRKTFITGDKKFEIVSEDELFEIDRSGGRERSVRCTKDPSPILKY